MKNVAPLDVPNHFIWIAFSTEFLRILVARCVLSFSTSEIGFALFQKLRGKS